MKDLPVTDPRRRCIPVVNGAGELLCWADDATGRELLRTKRASALHTRRGRIKALRSVDDAELLRGGSTPRPARYSHDRETGDNPHGCWTLVHLPASTRRIYRAVLEESFAA